LTVIVCLLEEAACGAGELTFWAVPEGAPDRPIAKSAIIFIGGMPFVAWITNFRFEVPFHPKD